MQGPFKGVRATRLIRKNFEQFLRMEAQLYITRRAATSPILPFEHPLRDSDDSQISSAIVNCTSLPKDGLGLARVVETQSNGIRRFVLDQLRSTTKAHHLFREHRAGNRRKCLPDDQERPDRGLSFSRFWIFPSALQFAFQSLGWSLPYQLFLALPYLLTLSALAGAAGRHVPPAALGRR